MVASPHARPLRRPLLAVVALVATAACGVKVCFLAAPTWGNALRRTRMVSVAMAQESPDVASYQTGDTVEAVFPDDGEWYPGTIEKVNDDGTLEVRWEDADGGPETSPCQASDVKKVVPRTPMEELKPGDKFKGTVTGSREFGVFVDIGAERDGLLHVSKFPPPKTGPFEEGDRVEAAYPDDEEWYPGVIAKDNGDGAFEVKWDDPDGGPESHSVKAEEIKHGQKQFNAEDEVEVWIDRVMDGKLGLSLSAPPPPPNLALMQGIHPDEWLEGTVVNIAPFGLFVSVKPPGGGDPQRGLVHVSQIRDGFVEDPNQEAEVGQEVKVRVVSVDEDRGKMGLSMRSGDGGGEPREQLPPPNLELMQGISPDEWLEGTVAAIAPFGLFVSVKPPGGGDPQRGLVHVSQIRDGFVEDANEEAEVGQEVKVRVLEVDMDRGKMSLSMRSDEGGESYEE